MDLRSTETDACNQRRRQAAALVGDLLRRWERGEATDDELVIAGRPDLLPELADELRIARMIRRAVVTARKAGAAPDVAVPLRLLSDEEIQAPIPLASAPSASAPDAAVMDGPPALPRIPGCVLLREVSVGGQAAVYRGIQESTGRAVAVKVIAGGSLSGSRQRARFDREAEILAALRHPHIVNILDRGRTADGHGDFYLLMEFVEGHDLDVWWDRHLPLNDDGTDRLLEVFAKLCRAVEEAHARGIVHRDLKPSNIRVDVRGEPRVLDFGLARPIHGGFGGAFTPRGSRVVTVSGQLLGSIPWASPEQAAGDSDRLDARSDVYSLGVMLYQALTGRFPYPVDGPLHQVLDRIATFAPPPPSRLRGTRPVRRGRWAALDAIALKALAKPPADRYASAGAMADDLDRLLAGKPVAVGRRAWRRRWRRPRHAALAAVASLAACGLGGTAWYLARPPAPPAVLPLQSITNSLDMHLVLVPGSTFTMGGFRDEDGRRRNDPPRRGMLIFGFYMATREVTQEQYRSVMGDRTPPQHFIGADLPIHGVSWADAAEFCRLLSAREGRTYRLPTEAEWEYACRAGSPEPFFGGHGPDYVAWHSQNSQGRLQPGGRKWANPWGLFDMHGNVGEWCSDEMPPLRPSQVWTSAATPSADTVASQLPARRVIRGGSVYSAPTDCRAASRLEVQDGLPQHATGFRVVLDTAGGGS